MSEVLKHVTRVCLQHAIDRGVDNHQNYLMVHALDHDSPEYQEALDLHEIHVGRISAIARFQQSLI